MTCLRGMPAFTSSGGKIFNWYCFSKPPTEATSATPGTDCSAGLIWLAIDNRVLINPADTACVGSERDDGVGWQLRPDGVDSIEHQLLDTRALRPIVEDDVYEGVPHVRGASDRLNIRRSRQCADQRLGNLRFQQLGAARPFRVNDDLGIGNVGN